MITDSLWAMLLGMIGIFIVMGILALVLPALNAITKNWKEDESD